MKYSQHVQFFKKEIKKSFSLFVKNKYIINKESNMEVPLPSNILAAPQ